MDHSRFEYVKQGDTALARTGTIRLLPASGFGGGAFAAMLPPDVSYTLYAPKGGLAVIITVTSVSAAAEQQARELMTSALGHL